MGHTTDANSATKQLPNLAAFVAVVQAGSFSAAGRKLGVDKTIVSRRVRALEGALGVRLLQRTTRKMATTEAGRRLFDQVESPLLETIQALIRATEPARIEGTVKIATGAVMGTVLWAPVVDTLSREYPDLRLQLHADERFVDVVGGGFDFALRFGNMPDSSLSARCLARWHYVLCATPEWVERREGNLEHPRDVVNDWVLFGGIPRANLWRFRRGDESVELETGAAVVLDSAHLAMAMVQAHVGVAPLPTLTAYAELEAGRLVRVLPEWQLEHEHRMWLVTPTRQYIPARVQATIAALEARVEALKPRWAAAYSPHEQLPAQ